MAVAAGCGGSGGSTGGGDPEGGSDGGEAPSEGGPGGPVAPNGAPFPYTPSNVPAPANLGVLGDVVLTQSCAIDTDSMGFEDCGDVDNTVYAFSSATQGDQSKVTVLALRSLTVAQSAQVSVQGSVPLVIVAANTVSIQAPVIAFVGTDEPNGGGFACTASGQGGGPGGGGAAMGWLQGSGGGGYCGIGGTGAAASPGQTTTPGGVSYGTSALVPLVGGSAGGAAAGGAVAGGGRGGGAIQISAGVSILVGSGGAISMPGYGGTYSGAGGGSGGAILLEAPSVQIQGVLAANGGASNEADGAYGAPGGQASAVPATYAGEPQAGIGSAGMAINGGNGGAVAGSPNATGGGGGAAGRIRINTQSGAATLAPGATVSPAPGTACVSQETLGT